VAAAYSSFAVPLFAALFAGARSRWRYLYLAAGMASFALFLVARGEGSLVGIAGAMLLLVPYWVSGREKLGRLFIMLAGWTAAYMLYNAYLSGLKKQVEEGILEVPLRDSWMLAAHAERNSAPLLILAAVLLAAGLCLLLLLKKWPVRAMRISGAVFLPVMLIAGLIALEIVGAQLEGQPGYAQNIIWQARELMHGRPDDDFGSGRIHIWREGIAAIPENPVFGTGPDTFAYAIEYNFERGVFVDKAHNVFLQIVVCMGIPALVAYIVFLGGMVAPAVKKAFERPLLLAFGAGAAGYIIQSFFMVEVPITTPLAWVALGVMAAELWMAKVGNEGIAL
jgi:hypothetical protein